jgi:hypothetical protein
MTQETEKERIYLEALDEINNLAIDVAMDFEETGIGSVDCGKIMDIVNKAFFAEANQQPSNTDKLSVEKLQEQLNSKVKALTEEIESIEKYLDKYGMSSYGANTRQAYLEGLRKALASIGGDDDENRL